MGEALDIFLASIKDLDNKETKDAVLLMPSKWNKDCDGAWRMNVDIAICNDEDNIYDQMVEVEEKGDSDVYYSKDVPLCDLREN